MANITLPERAVHKWLKSVDWSNDKTPMWTDGNTLYSYNTAIAYRVDDDEYYYVNRTYYTNTTCKHQNTLGRVLRVMVPDARIIYVNTLPWNVRGKDLFNEATRINPIKWSQLNTMLLEGHRLAEDKLGHVLLRRRGADPTLFGAHEHCPKCGHYMHITPQPVSSYDDRRKAKHFKLWGGAVRYKCSGRLESVNAPYMEECA